MRRIPDLSGTDEPPVYDDALWRKALRRALPYQVRLRARLVLMDTRGLSELWTRLDPRMLYPRITPETRLVIDGFPRSANSYAHMAFMHANDPDFPLCSHRHSYQSIRTGVRKGIPAITLIREPGPAIGSSLQFAPDTPSSTAIMMYKRFYNGILPVLPNVLVATFEEATTDFGDVIRRCNAKFGTAFVPYEKSDEAEAEVMRMIDRLTVFAFGMEDVDQKVPRPSQTRRSADEVLARLGPADQDGLREAEALYRRVLAARSG